MNASVHTILAASVSRLLKPLVRILIRHGVAYGTASEWLRKVYVDTAFEELASQGQKATITNVSSLTGLTRKETKRLNELDDDALHSIDTRYNRAIRVISGWKDNSDFQTEDGKPAELSLDTDSSSSFAALVKKYSGDMTTVSMLDMLQAAKCIELNNGKVKLIKDAYIPQGENSSLEKLTILGTDTAELMSTIGHNMIAPADQLLFQRKVSNTLLKTEDLELFKALAAKQSQELLENLHHWLVQHEIDPKSDASEKHHTVALGIYYHEQPTKEDTRS